MKDGIEVFTLQLTLSIFLFRGQHSYCAMCFSFLFTHYFNSRGPCFPRSTYFLLNSSTNVHYLSWQSVGVDSCYTLVMFVQYFCDWFLFSFLANFLVANFVPFYFSSILLKYLRFPISAHVSVIVSICHVSIKYSWESYCVINFKFLFTSFSISTVLFKA